MAQKEFTAPSGLVGIVRGLKLRELKMFNDRKGIKSGKVFEDLIETCWVETVDLGPAYKSIGRVQWATSALQGDKVAALMAIRRATHGDDFDFSLPCTDKSCRETIKWGVNLAEELPMKSYPANAITAHLNAEPFVTVIGGRMVHFELLTSEREKLMHKFVDARAKELDVNEATVAFRCKKVEGLSTRDEIVEWVLDLGLGEVMKLRDAMDAVSGGYETEVTIECGACGAHVEVELPLGGKDYWTPKTRTPDPRTKPSPASSSSESPTLPSGE